MAAKPLSGGTAEPVATLEVVPARVRVDNGAPGAEPDPVRRACPRLPTATEAQ
jgi:hypothetical protein